MTSEFTIAIHALVYLNHKKETLSSEALAQNVCTNPTRIRKVMAKLKKQNLIQTKEGKNGGYYFHLDAGKVTLKRVYECLDTRLLSISWTSGDQDMDCLIASGMAGIMDELYHTMEAQWMAYLDTITISQIEEKITQ